MISTKLHNEITNYRDVVTRDGSGNFSIARASLASAIESEIDERVAKEQARLEDTILNGDRRIGELKKELAEARATAPAPEHRPFDLEAARKGEAIEVEWPQGKWSPATFIGVNSSDSVVYDDEEGMTHWRPKNNCRMAPRPMRTVWLNVYEDGSATGHFNAGTADFHVHTGQAPYLRSYPVQVPAK